MDVSVCDLMKERLTLPFSVPSFLPTISLSFPAVSKATCKTASQLCVSVWNVLQEEGWHLPLRNVNITVSNNSYLNKDAPTSNIWASTQTG